MVKAALGPAHPRRRFARRGRLGRAPACRRAKRATQQQQQQPSPFLPFTCLKKPPSSKMTHKAHKKPTPILTNENEMLTDYAIIAIATGN